MKRQGLVLGALLALGACGIGNPATGEKIGQIVKMSQEGVMCTTWEGQIVRGGFNGGSGVNGASFEFTVEDDKLAAVALEYMRNQTEVLVRYHSEGIYSECRTESGGHFVYDIQPVLKPTPVAPAAQ